MTSILTLILKTDLVLDPHTDTRFTDNLSKRLGLDGSIKIKVDPTHYAERFEKAMLHLENLTPSQEEIYAQVRGVQAIEGRTDRSRP